MILVLLAACGGPEPAPPEKPEPHPVKVTSIPVVPSGPKGAPVTPGGPVPIELQFEGVGDLHQRYFADSEIVTRLAVDLGTCMDERAVLKISYDSENRIGRMRIYLDPKHQSCTPRESAMGVDLTPLQPIGEALARYRDTLAGRFDYRLASFRIELEALSGLHLCRLDLAGQFPPDGSTWAPCALLGGERACSGVTTEGVKVLGFDDPRHTAYLQACFR